MRSVLSLSSTTALYSGRYCYSSISAQSRYRSLRRSPIVLRFNSSSSCSVCRCSTSLPSSRFSSWPSSWWFWSKRGDRGCGRWKGVYCPLSRMEVLRSLLTRFRRTCWLTSFQVHRRAMVSEFLHVMLMLQIATISRVLFPQELCSATMFMRSSTSGTTDRNKGMVNQLQLYGIVNSSKVAEVMMVIDRGLFVPPGTPAYVDSPMQIGYNATISAPHMHATCLELLKEHLQPGMHALDVGSGTGYLTACFAMMVGSQGRAVGVEHIPELVASSIQNIKRSAATELLEGALSMHVADGRLGWPNEAPYDAIHVGAAAPEVPQALLDQLKPGGRLVIPVGKIFQDLQVIDKKLDGSIDVRTETSVRYVPLTSRDAQLRDY